MSYKAYAKTGGPTVCQTAMAHGARAVRSGIVGTSSRGTEATHALWLTLEPCHASQIILINLVAVRRLSSLLFFGFDLYRRKSALDNVMGLIKKISSINSGYNEIT